MLMIDCPLRQSQIKEYECYEISMAAEGLAPKRYLADNGSEIERNREICLNCPNHREDLKALAQENEYKSHDL